MRKSGIRTDEVPLLMYGHPSPQDESGSQLHQIDEIMMTHVIIFKEQ